MIRQFKLSKYYNKHLLVLFGNGFQRLVGLSTGFIIYHYIGSEITAGIYFILLSYVSLCEAGRYGFLSTATVKFFAGNDPERSATVLGSIWFLALAMSAIILILNGIGLFFLSYTRDPETILCIKWIGITYLSTLPADIIFWRLQAEEKYGKLFLYRMVNSISTILAFIILVVLHKFTLETAILYNFLTNCFCSLVGILWGFSGIKTIFNMSKACIMEIVHYGKYTFLTTSISSVLGNADLWIINSVLGPATVAVYTLAIRFLQVMDLPLSSFITTGMSEMAIQHNHKNMHQVTYIFKKYAGMLTIAFVPLTIVAFIGGIFVIKFYGGHNYDGADAQTAINVYGLFLIISIAYPIERFNGLALDIIHQTKINSYKMFVMLSVKIVTGLLFTMLLKNLYGIVISTYLMTIAAIFYGYYQLRKHLDYTIPGIVATGYSEMKVFLKKELKFLSRSKDNS